MSSNRDLSHWLLFCSWFVHATCTVKSFTVFSMATSRCSALHEFLALRISRASGVASLCNCSNATLRLDTFCFRLCRLDVVQRAGVPFSSPRFVSFWNTLCPSSYPPLTFDHVTAYVDLDVEGLEVLSQTNSRWNRWRCCSTVNRDEFSVMIRWIIFVSFDWAQRFLDRTELSLERVRRQTFRHVEQLSRRTFFADVVASPHILFTTGLTTLRNGSLLSM